MPWHLKKIKMRLWLLAMIAVALIIIAILMAMLTSPQVPVEFPKSYEVSIWQWDGPSRQPGKLDDVFQKLEADGFSTIYLNVSDYIDYYELTTPDRAGKLADFVTQVSTYISTAYKYNLTVQALLGNPMWSNSSHRYINQLAIDFVTQYNSQAATNARFTGIQFDLEPYGQKDFQSNQESLMQDYFDTVDTIVSGVVRYRDQSQDPNFKLGFTAPFWYDGTGNQLHKVIRNGSSAYPIFQLINVLAKQPNTYIALLAYRNYAYGTDGTIAISKNTIDYADNPLHRVHVVIGQEVTATDPAKITFHGTNDQVLKQAIAQVALSFQKNVSLAGFAVHDLDGYLELSK